MTPKFYELLSECIEDGIAIGLRQAHKHDDNPAFETVVDKIHSSVMSELHEWFDFEQ